MSLKRIMIIRHAEKPGVTNDDGGGVSPDGLPDEESLTVRGWQRAGALVRFFGSQVEMKPDVVFASGLGPGSKSMRPMETVSPLVAALKVDLITRHLKDDLRPAVDDVLSRDGVVLICWEHKRIPDWVGQLPGTPRVPQSWPDDRFDVVWILDRTDKGWSFTQLPQLLLSGDSNAPIE
jgi:broad specificity phosphatase PhoE